MNAITYIKRRFGAIVPTVAFVLTLFLPATALAYDAPLVARLSEVLDEAFVLGKDDVEWSYAEPNLIIEEGDLLQTNETGMVEAQFEGDVVFRIGERTRVAVIEIGEEKVMGMDSGRAYLRVAREFSPAETFILTFPTGQLSATGKTLTRIDVFEDGGAEVRVIRGAVELATISEVPTLVRAGERVSINSGGWTGFSGLDLARADDFDAWNESRDIALSTYRRPSYVDGGLVGAEDLEGYGEWVYADRFGSRGWRPYVVEGWSPYSYGRWYYSNRFGWTWIPEEPWGYVTYHYGSWNYDPYYGWIWVPGTVWRPAYVHWVGYDDYIGWVPVGYYGYPVITTYPYHITKIYTSYVDFYSFTFVYVRDFHHRHHHKKHHRRHKDDRHEFHDKDRRHIGDTPRVGKDYKEIPVSPDRRPALIEKLKADPGKLRVIKNIENEKLQKHLRKGSVERGRFDFEKIANVDKHPDLRARIAKLKQARERINIQHNGSLSPNLPKKVEKDQVKALDFRERAKKRVNVRPENRALRGSVEWNGKLHKVNREEKTVQRVPEVTRRAVTGSGPSTVTPEKKYQAPERPQPRRDVEQPEQVRTKIEQIERLRTPNPDRPTRVEKRRDGNNVARPKLEERRESVRSDDSIDTRARQQSLERLRKRRIQTRREIQRVDRVADMRTTVSIPAQQDRRQSDVMPPRVETRPIARPAEFERVNAPQRFERNIDPPAQRQSMREQAGRAAGPELNGSGRGASADSFVKTQMRPNNSRRQVVNESRGPGGRRR